MRWRCSKRTTPFVGCDQNKINHLHFHGFGCAISKASTSILTKSIEGMGTNEALSICNAFLHFINKETAENELPLPDDFLAFAGVHDFPERYDCATLSWREMKKFLESRRASS
jgi:nitrogen fixation protein NifU and related proteins